MEVVMAQDVEWIFCSTVGQKIPQVSVFFLPIQQMVAQGNLLALGIMFMDNLFSFNFF
jgi:hypothetical protein